MTVYVVEQSGWDYGEVMGVYSSMEAAQAAYPQPEGRQWVTDQQGKAYVNGLPRGQCETIEPFEVKA